MSNIAEYARNRFAIKDILVQVGPAGIEDIVIIFLEGGYISYYVDVDTDELVFNEIVDFSLARVSLHKLFPERLGFLGWRLLWSWEMINHQGYFDALQLELFHSEIPEGLVLQFKVVASHIYVGKVVEFPRVYKDSTNQIVQKQ